MRLRADVLPHFASKRKWRAAAAWRPQPAFPAGTDLYALLRHVLLTPATSLLVASCAADWKARVAVLEIGAGRAAKCR